jgi:adenosylmethionine-8-amino-7-oxononanoate aminotransferase
MSVFHKWGGGLDPSFPRIEDAHDEFLVTADGTELVDAAAGAAVANLGHSLSVGDAFAEQAADVSYVSLSHFEHDAPELLSERLAAMTPGDLDAAFFVNSGSEANESAFKLARAYHEARGDSRKRKVIGRWQSYHGCTLGALSASGNASRRRTYDGMLAGWPHVSPAYPYRWDYEGSPEEQARAAAAEVERTIRQEGPETVAAFVAEPVGGSSIPAAAPHPAYYREVRRLCDDHDVLFVADEVMTGFCRTGERFGVDHYDVVPDVMTLGKGLSAGYAPIAAAMVSTDVAETFAADGPHGFSHGHTFSGHPPSAAVAAEVVGRYDDALLADVREKGRFLAGELSSLRSHPNVGDFRRRGLMVGVEFVADAASKRPFDPDEDVADRVFEACLDRGVYVYPGSGCADGTAGDHVMLAPPLTASEESLSRIATALTEAVETVFADVTTESR